MEDIHLPEVCAGTSKPSLGQKWAYASIYGRYPSAGQKCVRASIYDIYLPDVGTSVSDILDLGPPDAGHGCYGGVEANKTR